MANKKTNSRTQDCRAVGMRYRSEYARKRISKAVQGNRTGGSISTS